MIEEYKGSLRRAFEDADYIIVDGWCNRYIKECTDWALNEGFISPDKMASKKESDSQYTALCYRLTDKGHKELRN